MPCPRERDTSGEVWHRLMREDRTMEKMCESCEVVGIKSTAITVRNGEQVCQDCAEDIDHKENEQQSLKEAYEQRDKE